MIDEYSWLIIKVVWWLKSIDDKVLLTLLMNEQMDNTISRVAFATENTIDLINEIENDV